MERDLIRELVLWAANTEFDITEREVTLPEDTGQILTVYGPRRSGKTFLLLGLGQYLKSRGRRVAYINLEDERLGPDIDLGRLFEVIRDIVPGEGTLVLMLDEIQQVPDWELIVRRIHEHREAELILTGSSSRLMSREISTKLRGRTLSTRILPFSFREYLTHRGIPWNEDSRLGEGRVRIRRALSRYLLEGGYPDTVREMDEQIRWSMLQQYTDTMFYRDIVERHGIRPPEAIRRLMRILFNSTGSRVSISRIHNQFRTLGLSTGKDTLLSYSSMLEDAGIVYLVEVLSDSYKARQVNPRKCYIVDPGLVVAHAPDRKSLTGRLLETVVFLDLIRRGDTVTYFNGKRECDFVTLKNGVPSQAIQVSWELTPSCEEREVQGVLEAMKVTGLKEGTIITFDQSLDSFRELGVEVIPAWKWLLDR